MSVAVFQHNFIYKSKQRVKFCHLTTVCQLLTEYKVGSSSLRITDYQLDDPAHPTEL